MIRLFPNYDQALNNLANILKSQGELKEAEDMLRKALDIRKEFPAAWMNLGIVLTQINKYSEAEDCYKNALKYRKYYPDCHYNLGNLVSDYTLLINFLYFIPLLIVFSFSVSRSEKIRRS